MIDFHVIIAKIENGRMGVFPTDAVGNSVYEEINLVRGYQRNRSRRIYVGEIWIHHRLIVFEFWEKRYETLQNCLKSALKSKFL